MITITDEVINGTSGTIDLTNFSYLRRKNYEPENKFFILHEGPLGVFNDTLKEVSYDELHENREIVEFELAAPTDLAGVHIPKRQCTRSIFPSIGTFN